MPRGWRSIDHAQTRGGRGAMVRGGGLRQMLWNIHSGAHARHVDRGAEIRGMKALHTHLWAAASRAAIQCSTCLLTASSTPVPNLSSSPPSPATRVQKGAADELGRCCDRPNAALRVEAPATVLGLKCNADAAPGRRSWRNSILGEVRTWALCRSDPKSQIKICFSHKNPHPLPVMSHTTLSCLFGCTL